MGLADIFGGGYGSSILGGQTQPAQFQPPKLPPLPSLGATKFSAPPAPPASTDQPPPQRLDVNNAFTNVAQGLGFDQQQQPDVLTKAGLTGLSAVAALGQAPSYIDERPLATADTLIKDFTGVSPIDSVEKFVGGIPVVGNLVGGVGDALGMPAQAMSSMFNSQIAQSLKETAGQPDSAILSGSQQSFGDTSGLGWFGEVLNGLLMGLPGIGQQVGNAAQGKQMTVGQLRAAAAQRGFTDQDIADLQAGRKTTMDFGDKMNSPNELIDITGRIATDPTNLLFGAGALAKLRSGAGFLGKLVSIGASTDKAVDAARVADSIATGGADASKSLTLAGMGKYWQSATRGTTAAAAALNGAKVVQLYRKASLGLTAAEVGTDAALNLVDPNGGNEPGGGFLEGLHQLANDLVNNRPLSSNQTFSMFDAMTFPVRSLTGGAGGAISRAYRSATGSDVDAQLANAMGHGSNTSAKLADLKARLGGTEAYNEFRYHIEANLIASRLPPALKDAYRVVDGNVDTAILQHADYAKVIDSEIQRAHANNTISGRDVVQQVKDWYGSQGGHAEIPVKQVWNPDQAVQSWVNYRTPAAQAAIPFAARGDAVLGLANELTKEQATQASFVLSQYAKDGMVAKEDIQKVTNTWPQLVSGETPGNPYWASLTSGGGPESVSLRELQGKLSTRAKNAPSYRDLTYESAKREASAPPAVDAPPGPVDPQTGRPVPDFGLPVRSSVHLQGQKLTGPKGGNLDALGASPTTVAQAQSLRASPKVAAVEQNVGRLLTDAGFNVKTVAQSIDAHGGIVEPAVDISTTRAYLPELREMASVLGRTLKQDQVTISIPQHALNVNGLKANGWEFSWKVPLHDQGAIEAARNLLGQHFPDFTLKDSNDTISVLLKDAEAPADLQTKLEAIDTGLADIAGLGPIDRHSLVRSASQAYIEQVGKDIPYARLTKGSAPRAQAFKARVSELAPPESTPVVPGESARPGAGPVRESAAAAGPGGQVSGAANQVTPQAVQAAYDNGDIANGQALNKQVGIANGGTVESGGAVLSGEAARARAEVRASQEPMPPTATPVEHAANAAIEGVADKTVPPIQTATLAAHDLRGSNGDWGQVVYDAQRDAQVGKDVPRPPLYGKMAQDSPEYEAQLQAFNETLAQNFPGYEIKPPPQLARFFEAGQGGNVASALQTRTTLGQLLDDFGPTARLTNFTHWLLDPRPNHQSGQDAKQALMTQLIPNGAKPKEVDAFLKALQAEAERHKIGPVQFFRGPSGLLPSTIKDIATKTFSPETVLKVGADNFWKALDKASNTFTRKVIMRQASGQGVGKMEQALNGLYELNQNLPTGKAGRVIGKTMYPIFRFVSDPRWWAMNSVEADVMGLTRDGLSATRFSKDVRGKVESTASRMHAGTLTGPEQDAGLYLARNNAGYISRTFDAERPESTMEVLRGMPAHDPVIGALTQRFGTNTEDWVKGIDDMLYNFDQQGVPKTVEDAAKQYLSVEDRKTMAPLLTKVYEQNQALHDSLTNVFNGNTSRSNVERALNSYWLYWPISYQLKAGKWLMDAMTKRSFGKQTNLLLAAKYNELMDLHKQRMVADPGYVKLFSDNPEMWFAAQMLLPIDPSSLGVSLSRPLRYAGGALGLWGAYKQASDPISAALGIANIGPDYTATLLKYVAQELGKSSSSDVAPSSQGGL